MDQPEGVASHLSVDVLNYAANNNGKQDEKDYA
jgi:hypothetical protein